MSHIRILVSTTTLLIVLGLSGCKGFFGDDWGWERYPCENDDDCQAGLLCGDNGFCGYACDTDRDCTSSSVCVGAKVCQPSLCKSDDDCNNLATCNTDLGLCEQLACDENTGQCPSILTCDERWMECRPKTCKHDDECDQAGAACNEDNGVCYLVDFPVPPVTCTKVGESSDNGCSKTPGHLQCVDFSLGKDQNHLYCTHYCESDFDCGKGSVCMVGFGPFDSNQNKVNTFCGSPDFMTNGVGRLCSDDTDCAEGRECLSVPVLGTEDRYSVCTVTNCDENEYVCPPGWSCCMIESSVKACILNPTDEGSCQ